MIGDSPGSPLVAKLPSLRSVFQRIESDRDSSRFGHARSSTVASEKWAELSGAAANSSYFCDVMTGKTAWVLPRQALEAKLAAFYHARLKEHRTESDLPSPQRMHTEDATMSESFDSGNWDQVTQVNGVQEQKHARQISCAVRIHPDSGQVFYVDYHTGVASWRDPSADNTEWEMLDQLDLARVKQNVVEEAERLAGFGDAENPEIFECEQFEAYKQRLTEWMRQNKLRIPESNSIMFKYPEYVQFDQDTSMLDKIVSILVWFPQKEERHGVRSMSVVGRIEEPLQTLLDSVLKKHKVTTGAEITPSESGVFVFKVVGFMDYFLHMQYRLGDYDHIRDSMRKQMKLELELVELSVIDAADLMPGLTMSRDEGIEAERNKCRPNGDDWLGGEIDLRFAGGTEDCIDFSEIRWPLRALVRGVEGCSCPAAVERVHVEMQVCYNGRTLTKSSPTPSWSGWGATTNLTTTSVAVSDTVRFSQEWLSTGIEVASLPPTARIGFVVVGITGSGQHIPLASVALPLVDYARTMMMGKRLLRLWTNNADVATMIPEENLDEHAPVLHVVFDSYALPVRASIPTWAEVMMGDIDTTHSPVTRERAPTVFEHQMTRAQKDALNAIERLDALHELTAEQKQLLWVARHVCQTRSNLLPRFLQAIDWGRPSLVSEVYSLLPGWQKPADDRKVDIIELLDIRFSDPVVREYAVQQLDQLPDAVLSDILLQLVQVLKYETYRDSPLVRMLLRRAILAPYRIGHRLFWLLKSEMYKKEVAPRFGLLLLLYIIHCGPHRTHLRRQVFVNDKIRVVADQVKRISGKAERVRYAQEELAKLNPLLPSKFQLCLSPRIECRSIVVEKCKVMSSKKLPLWIVFENADPRGDQYYAIFKSGDDLRQDQMTLQMLRIMDGIWSNAPNNLSLYLNPYGCCSTGQDLGMIEVVRNADTTAHIQMNYGGKLSGAFKATPIDLFLREHNKDSEYGLAVEHFVRSCAGYCVATYVLGIGDRHADNIMVTESGHLFHIDFGHFLGNFKSKFGIKRERAPFVFTPEMAYVMEGARGERFQQFKDLCCQAYNLVRERANLFITLFVLMVPAAMPELLEVEDVTYLREQLVLDLSPEQAAKNFVGQIHNSLKTVSRRVDNWIHNLKHG